MPLLVSTNSSCLTMLEEDIQTAGGEERLQYRDLLEMMVERVSQ